MNTILERHYQRGMDACQHLFALDSADHAGLVRAVDCAALHVGLDAMSRIQAKRKPQAGCVASYPPIARRTVLATTAPLVALLSRHAQRVHDARTFGGDAKASLQATTVALVSVLR